MTKHLHPDQLANSKPKKEIGSSFFRLEKSNGQVVS